MSYLIEDNPAQHRFEILVDDSLAGFAEYRQRQGVVILTHTEIDPASQGKGIGSALARGALDQIRQHGDRVIPQCRFIAAFIAKHPEYADLVTESRQSG